MQDSNYNPALLIVGQTPPPWHGQAVGTKLLFDYQWPGVECRCLRMAYSDEMHEIGRIGIGKVFHLVHLVRETRRFLKKHPDAVLLYPPASPHWIPFLRDVIYLRLVRRYAAKTVFLFHAGGFGEFFDRSWLLRWIGGIYQQPDLCLEVAIEERTPHEALNCPASKWIPYGVDVPEVPRVPKKTTAPVEVLFVGSLQEGKGVLELIRTARVLRDRGQALSFRFRLVGRWFSTEFKTQAMRLVEELDVAGMVEFVGQKTGGEKWEAYANADLFFFPSHYESEAFPIVVIEALGSGLPVVSTRWRGIPSIVEGSGVARLEEVRSPEAFAGALEAQAGKLARADELAAEARTFYLSRYTPEHFLTRVRDALAPLLGNASAEAPALRQPERPIQALQVFNQYLERGGEEVWVDHMPELARPAVEVNTLRFHSRSWIDQGRPNRIRQALLIRDNPASRSVLRETVGRQRPDVLVFHNILPVGSLGLYDEAAELGIPVVQYIHNFRPFSPSGTLWTGKRTHQGALGGNLSAEILHAAWESSLTKTALLAFHLKRFRDQGGLERVTRWIAVSEFMRSKFIDAGIPAKKIVTLRHCWKPEAKVGPRAEGDYYLFLGRLVSEKGLQTLLDAWVALEDELGEKCPRLVIGGSGPEEDRVQRAVLDSRRIDFRGYVAGSEKDKLLAHCRALIVPSIWWEPLGLTVYEAYDYQRPVLAAMTGGLSETVVHGRTGYHHEPGEAKQLKQSVLRIEADGSEKRAEMGIAGRHWLERAADPEQWRRKLSFILSEVVGSDQSKNNPQCLSAKSLH